MYNTPMPTLEAHSAIQALDMGGTGHKVRGFLAVDVSPLTPQRNSQHPFLYNPVGRETPNTARERLRELIQEGQRDINHQGYRLVGIGADMPDPSDYKRGIFQASHKKDLSPLVGMRLDAILAPEHGDEPMDDIPIFYLNDGDAGAKGVMHKYKDRRILVVTFGRGLGGGFVVDGKMAAEGQGAPKGGEIWNLDIHDPSGEYVH